VLKENNSIKRRARKAPDRADRAVARDQMETSTRQNSEQEKSSTKTKNDRSKIQPGAVFWHEQDIGLYSPDAKMERAAGKSVLGAGRQQRARDRDRGVSTGRSDGGSVKSADEGAEALTAGYKNLREATRKRRSNSQITRAP
jgi:hypothetical protein